jgi:hypothetical protein
MIVTRENDELVLDINQVINARISHWHYDTFRGWFGKWWREKVTVQFTLNQSGKVTNVNVDGMIFTKEAK